MIPSRYCLRPLQAVGSAFGLICEGKSSEQCPRGLNVSTYRVTSEVIGKFILMLVIDRIKVIVIENYKELGFKICFLIIIITFLLLANYFYQFYMWCDR